MAPDSPKCPRLSVVIIPPSNGGAANDLVQAFRLQDVGPGYFELLFPLGCDELVQDAQKSGLAARTISVAAAPRADFLNTAHLAASADIVLPFFAEDTPDSKLISTHLCFHDQHPAPNTAVTVRSVVRIADSINSGPISAARCLVDPRRSLAARARSILTKDKAPHTPWTSFSLGLTSYHKAFAQIAGGYDRPLSELLDLDLAFRLHQLGLRVLEVEEQLVFAEQKLTIEKQFARAEQAGMEAGIIQAKYNGDPGLELLELCPNVSDLRNSAEVKLGLYRSIRDQLESNAVYDPAAELFHIPGTSPCAPSVLGEIFDALAFYRYQVGAAEVTGAQRSEINPIEALSKIPSVLLIVDSIPSRLIESSTIAWFETAKELLADGLQVSIAATTRLENQSLETVRILQDLGASIYGGPLKRISGKQSIDTGARTDLRKLLCEREYDVVVVASESAKKVVEEVRRFHKTCAVVVDSSSHSGMTLARSGRKVGNNSEMMDFLDKYGCRSININSESSACFVPRQLPPAGWAARHGVLLLSDTEFYRSSNDLNYWIESTWKPISRLNRQLVLFIPAERPADSVDSETVLWCGSKSSLEVLGQQARLGIVPAATGAGFKPNLLAFAAKGLPLFISLQQARRWDLPKAAVLSYGEDISRTAEEIVSLYDDQESWTQISILVRELCAAENSCANELTAIATKQLPQRRSLPSTPMGKRGMVSIVIPVFNKVEFTKQCVEHILPATTHTPFEVIIVDNGSTDGTAAYCAELTSHHPNIRVITNSINSGFAQGCNQGAAAALGEFVLFLNNDTAMAEGWLEPLVRILENEPSVGAVGSKLLYPDGTIQHAGIFMIRNRLAPLFWPFHLFRGLQANDPSICTRQNRQAVTGACVLVRASQFQAVCGFDEEFWNGCEDVDLCFKLRAHGMSIVYEPASTVIHFEAQSGVERFRCESQNLERLLAKWGGAIRPDEVGYPLDFPVDRIP